jgi:tetratricopeptide (TPR) repeat protein
MRGLVFAVMVVLLATVGLAQAKPCPKGSSHIGKRCVIDRWNAGPTKPAPKLHPLMRAPSPTITLAALHTQGDTAYKAGRYDSAAANFSAVLDSKQSAELTYHAAQAYRMAGDWAKALELYEQYLDLAPDGPAAPVCRAQIERLRDVP